MGCDIHIVVERREKGSPEWVGVYASDTAIGGRPKVAQRDYGFFARVASVRGRVEGGLYPRNLPKDVSRLAWLLYMRCPTDYHNPSHMSPTQFAAAWIVENPTDTTVRPDHAVWDLLGIDGDEEAEHRIVFWFDN